MSKVIRNLRRHRFYKGIDAPSNVMYLNEDGIFVTFSDLKEFRKGCLEGKHKVTKQTRSRLIEEDSGFKCNCNIAPIVTSDE